MSTRSLRPFSGPIDETTWVVRVDPCDGSAYVLRDTPVLVRLSAPINPGSVTHRSVRVVDPGGPIPAQLALSADERVVIWCPDRRLIPGVEHEVLVGGLVDRRGRPVPNHSSRFYPCGIAREDLCG